MNKAERTRQLIVERTAPLFNTKGYAGTSVTDMTDATGLTKGSVYGNFANKEEVALAAFEHNWKQVQAAVRLQMDKHNTNKEKLLAMMDVHQNPQLHGFPAGGCPLLNTAVEADDTHPALRKLAAAAFHAWKKELAGVVASGIAAGEFRPNVEPERIAVTLIALIEGSVMISGLTGNSRYRKAIAPAMEGIIRDLA
jgi:TetR/AcrR family transcriptional regulator, transcriptional repressor for nem operon